MAIRDRVTVKTKDGVEKSLVVARQGGTIEVSEPTQRDPYFRVSLLNKQGEEEGTSLTIPAMELLWLYKDKSPK